MTREEKIAAAKTALTDFWGYSNGGVAAWRKCEAELRALKLKKDELELLEVELPSANAGSPVAARVDAASRILRAVSL